MCTVQHLVFRAVNLYQHCGKTGETSYKNDHRQFLSGISYSIFKYKLYTEILHFFIAGRI